MCSPCTAPFTDDFAKEAGVVRALQTPNASWCAVDKGVTRARSDFGVASLDEARFGVADGAGDLLDDETPREPLRSAEEESLALKFGEAIRTFDVADGAVEAHANVATLVWHAV
mmetsp:Transcript_10444/g.30273  ORF Transcript_10444/g.30273 Transcript_10444/m.30273 type:complete len:114 (+) Transcript_10444:893-1234(+)